MIKFELGIKQQKNAFVINVSGEVRKRLDESFVGILGDDINECSEIINEVLRMHIDSYPAIGKNNYDFVRAFMLSNNILSDLTEDEQFIYAYSVILCILNIRTSIEDILTDGDTNKIVVLCNSIHKILVDMESKLNITDRCKQYAEKFDIRIADTIGTREHDTKELTWFEPHYREYYAIIMFVKLMSPLVFCFIDESKTKIVMKTGYAPKTTKKVIDNRRKEYYALHMFENIIKENWSDTYEKLCYYINHIVIREQIGDTQNKEAVVIFNDATTEQVIVVILAMLFNKHFIKQDLLDSNLDLMSSTTGKIKQFFKDVSNDYRNVYYTRLEPKYYEDQKSTKKSNLENDSVTSKDLFDIECIVSYLVDETIEKYMKFLKIDKHEFEKVNEFNIQSIKTFPEHVIFLLTSMFGRDLNGSVNVLRLNKIQICGLITVVQYISIELDCFEIALIMNAERKLIGNKVYEQQHFDIQDKITIRNNAIHSCKEQRELKESLNPKIRVANDTTYKSLIDVFNKLLEDFLQLFIDYKWYLKTSPILIKKAGLDINMGDLYTPSSELITQYCKLLKFKLEESNRRENRRLN